MLVLDVWRFRVEIVEGEGNGSCGCAQAHAGLTAGCMLWVLVSIELAGGTSAAFDTPSLPPDGSRQQRVLLRVHSWNCTLAMLAEGFRSARRQSPAIWFFNICADQLLLLQMNL
jgi:hypothetical protein